MPVDGRPYESLSESMARNQSRMTGLSPYMTRSQEIEVDRRRGYTSGGMPVQDMHAYLMEDGPGEGMRFTGSTGQMTYRHVVEDRMYRTITLALYDRGSFVSESFRCVASQTIRMEEWVALDMNPQQRERIWSTLLMNSKTYPGPRPMMTMPEVSEEPMTYERLCNNISDMRNVEESRRWMEMMYANPVLYNPGARSFAPPLPGMRLEMTNDPFPKLESYKGEAISYNAMELSKIGKIYGQAESPITPNITIEETYE
jgi:hypothetical protein